MVSALAIMIMKSPQVAAGSLVGSGRSVAALGGSMTSGTAGGMAGGTASCSEEKVLSFLNEHQWRLFIPLEVGGGDKSLLQASRLVKKKNIYIFSLVDQIRLRFKVREEDNFMFLSLDYARGKKSGSIFTAHKVSGPLNVGVIKQM